MSSLTSASDSLPPPSTSALRAELARLLALKKERRDTNRLARYSPYAKQLEFHAAGLTKRERLLMAANQTGKSWSGSMEMAMHLTGRYPEWWQGRRWERPITAWAAGVSGEATRDNVQRLLFGRTGQTGTGAIPRDDIGEVMNARGVADLVDTALIKHVSGGTSTIALKSYEKGREKWQGETLDLVWFDEEPPNDVYKEGLTRTNATSGSVYLTFTPLLGMSEVVRSFLQTTSADRHVTKMTIDDAEHYTPEERERITARYAPHEREARIKGEPALGQGRIFPLADEAIAVDAFNIPGNWWQIGGLDFGWDHPTAAIKLAWDRDADCLYVTQCYRVREATPVIHAASLRPWGSLPWSWPHDGMRHDNASGDQLAELYRQQGLDMLHVRATFEDGSNGVEAGVAEMLSRMQTGRWKVFRHLTEWFEEFRLYHRKDGKIVKLGDDLISASRYAMMMRRYAVPVVSEEEGEYRVRGSRSGAGWMGA